MINEKRGKRRGRISRLYYHENKVLLRKNWRKIGKWGEKVKTLFSLGTRESGFEGCEKAKLYFRLTENKIRGYKTVEINGF